MFLAQTRWHAVPVACQVLADLADLATPAIGVHREQLVERTIQVFQAAQVEVLAARQEADRRLDRPGATGAALSASASSSFSSSSAMRVAGVSHTPARGVSADEDRAALPTVTPPQGGLRTLRGALSQERSPRLRDDAVSTAQCVVIRLRASRTQCHTHAHVLPG